MMKTILMAAAAMCAFAATSAQAETVTFEEGGANTIYSGPATSGAYTFGSSAGHFHFGNGLAGVPSNGTGILLEDRDAVITMTNTGGASFNLLSGDFGEDTSLGASSLSILVTGFFTGGGSISQSIVLDGNTAAFQNAALVGFTGLSSVTFDGIGGAGGFTLDNLQVSVGNAVPEPATWAMLLFGFGGLGYAMRRRQSVSARIRFA